MGLEIRRSPSAEPSDHSSGPRDPDSLAVAHLQDAHYYVRWYPSHPLFAPWIGHPDFARLYDGVAANTLVSADRCYILGSLARYASRLEGNLAECGVWRGGTALLIARVLSNSDHVLHLFDSFEGLPEADPIHDNWYGKGDFADTSLASVIALLRDHAQAVEFHAGWMPGTFASVRSERFAMVHVDVDLYRPAWDCCEFFYPRLCRGGIMVFDDYGFPACHGERDAVDAYFAGKPEPIIALPTGQGILIKA